MIALLAALLALPAAADPPPAPNAEARALLAQLEARKHEAPLDELAQAVESVRALAPELSRIRAEPPRKPGTVGAGASGVYIIARPGLWHFVFHKGWGDCPSGCIHNQYWYFTYDRAKKEAEKLGDCPPEQARAAVAHLWNVPARFSAGQYDSYEELTQTLATGEWWRRVHAATVLGLLLERPSKPLYGEDTDGRGKPSAAYARLSAQVQKNKDKSRKLLEKYARDPDADVAAAAKAALAGKKK